MGKKKTLRAAATITVDEKKNLIYFLNVSERFFDFEFMCDVHRAHIDRVNHEWDGAWSRRLGNWGGETNTNCVRASHRGWRQLNHCLFVKFKRTTPSLVVCTGTHTIGFGFFVSRFIDCWLR